MECRCKGKTFQQRQPRESDAGLERDTLRDYYFHHMWVGGRYYPFFTDKQLQIDIRPNIYPLLLLVMMHGKWNV